MANLLVRPRFDSATEYSFAFAQEILDWCQQANIPILDLPAAEAIRAKVEAAISAEDPPIFVFYDHGNETSLIGNDQTPIVDLGNCRLLAGREVYTLACLSAKELGKVCYDLGTKFWGYVETVGFTSDAIPAFQESFNCGFRYRFLEGNSPKDTLELAKDTFTNLAYTLTNQGNIFAAAIMTANRDALRYYDGEKPEEEPEGCLVALFKSPWVILRRIWSS